MRIGYLTTVCFKALCLLDFTLHRISHCQYKLQIQCFGEVLLQNNAMQWYNVAVLYGYVMIFCCSITLHNCSITLLQCYMAWLQYYIVAVLNNKCAPFLQ